MTDPAPHDPRDVVVLVDPDGTPRGTAPRWSVHTHDTPLHLAFSSYLFDAGGRLLLTRRALDKRTWPGVWSNSCCGHLLPDEAARDAAQRRIREELGAPATELVAVLPDFRYRAVDASGVVENEICPVFAGRIEPAALAPAPGEIAEWCWVPWSAVVAVAHDAPALLSPWAVLQMRELDAAGFTPSRSLSDAASHPLSESKGPVPASNHPDTPEEQR